VFIEQRGTGESNPLTCPAFPATLADKAALRASVESCRAHLHGDLRLYTTAMFTDDVSQILTALHYTKADLIGGFYGPTAEQVFLLRHPGQVRTMTMLNATLLTIPMFEREAGNSQLALHYVFALCQSQLACHQAFPHTRSCAPSPGRATSRRQPRHRPARPGTLPHLRQLVL
jgi:pimeloyl-ACP methyl ester carboxylesterase